MTSQHSHVFPGISRVARTFPDKTAIVTPDGPVSYADLMARVQGAAHLIASSCTSEAARVAVLSGDRFDCIVALLACLKIGASFCPLDAGQSDALLAAKLNALHADVILDATGRIETQANARHWANLTADAETPTPWFDAPAYVFFSSGTTGPQKAIVGTQKGVKHFVDWERQALAINADVIASQIVSPVFDAFLRDVLVPLTAGGTLVLAPDAETILDPASLRNWLREARVSLVHTVPSIARPLMASLSGSADLPDLRLMALSGERITRADVAQWLEHFGTRARLFNFFGPSETTMTKLFHEVTPADLDQPSVPVGQPLPGVTLTLRDTDGNEVPRGARGELFIETEFGTLGYLDAAMSEGVFDVLDTDTNLCRYRTGDMCSINENGDVLFFGRGDDVVKVSGVRVDCVAVEIALQRVTPETPVIVTAHRDARGATALHALVAGAQERDLLALRVRASQVLAAGHVPSAFWCIDSIPRTQSGKIDRRACAARLDAILRDVVVPEFAGLEQKIADIWRDLTGITLRDLAEDLSLRGGNSLSLIRMINRVSQAFEVMLNPADVLPGPTLQKISAAIGKAQAIAPARASETDEDTPFVLSSMQRWMWFLHRQAPSSDAYNVKRLFALSSDLDANALVRAVETVLNQHPVLRTRYGARDGVPFQSIVPEPLVRVERLSAADTDLAAAFMAQPFDLSEKSCRVALIALPDGDWQLAFCFHHIAMDEWSLEILFSQFSDMYAGVDQGTSPGQSVHDSVLFEARQNAVNKAAASDIAAKLSAAPHSLSALEMLPQRRTQAPERRTTRIWLSRDTEAIIQDQATSEGTTLIAQYLSRALWAMTRLNAGRTPVFALPVANRLHPGAESAVGFFANTAPFWVDHAAATPDTLPTAAVHDALQDLLLRQAVPFDMIVGAARPKRRPFSVPLCQVAFSYYDKRLQTLHLGGVGCRAIPIENHALKFDVEIDVERFEQGHELRVSYAADLYSAQHIRDLIADLLSGPDPLTQNCEGVLMAS